MELIIVLALSFFSALIVGYFGVAIQKGAEKLDKNSFTSSIGKWLYLFPLFDKAETIVAGLFDYNLRKLNPAPLISMIMSFLVGVALLALSLIALALVISALWFLLFNHFFSTTATALVLGLIAFAVVKKL